jgi:hypothetical protein
MLKIIASLFLLVVSHTSIADPLGPFTVTITSPTENVKSYCIQLQLYLNGSNLYGKSIGCPGSGASSFYISAYGGFYDPQTNTAVFARYLDNGSEKFNTPTFTMPKMGSVSVYKINLNTMKGQEFYTSDQNGDVFGLPLVSDINVTVQ